MYKFGLLAISAFIVVFAQSLSSTCAKAQTATTYCQPTFTNDGWQCRTRLPEAPKPDPIDTMIAKMPEECLSATGALSEMLMAMSTPTAGGNWQAMENGNRVAEARRQRCAQAKAAADQAAARRQLELDLARIEADGRLELARQEAIARKQADAERTARVQWMSIVSQAVLEGRCSEAREIALRQGNLEVADQVVRVCIPATPVKKRTPNK
jgi:hypothetical protein